jgi:hypothetical protein
MARESVRLFATLGVAIHHKERRGRKLQINFQFVSLHQLLVGKLSFYFP